MDFLSSITSTMLNKALDVAHLQQQVVAKNVANVDTQNYKPLKVDFSALMNDISNIASREGNEQLRKDELKSVDLSRYVTVDDLAVKVELDEQIIELNKTMVQYQALLTAKSKLGGIMKTAINGGRS